MVTTEYRNAYSEVLEILKHIPKEEFNKIPPNMVEMFRQNASRENKFIYLPNKTLQEQNVSKKAKTIIAILFRDYWATETQRQKIITKQTYDRQNLRKEKYNPDSLLKNKQSIIKENEEEQQLVIYKEPLFKRIVSKILTFLHIK